MSRDRSPRNQQKCSTKLRAARCLSALLWRHKKMPWQKQTQGHVCSSFCFLFHIPPLPATFRPNTTEPPAKPAAAPSAPPAPRVAAPPAAPPRAARPPRGSAAGRGRSAGPWRGPGSRPRRFSQADSKLPRSQNKSGAVNNEIRKCLKAKLRAYICSRSKMEASKTVGSKKNGGSCRSMPHLP